MLVVGGMRGCWCGMSGLLWVSEGSLRLPGFIVYMSTDLSTLAFGDFGVGALATTTTCTCKCLPWLSLKIRETQHVSTELG